MLLWEATGTNAIYASGVGTNELMFPEGKAMTLTAGTPDIGGLRASMGYTGAKTLAEFQARAEFIRVQCELERCTPDDDRRAALQKRESALLKKHRAGWTAEAEVESVKNTTPGLPLASM